MDKFGRNFNLIIGAETPGPPAPALSIGLPFTIEFDITRNTLTSANVCQIRLFNLSAKNRNLIRFNAYDSGTHRGIVLFAGYGDNPPIIFTGNISQAFSVRQGVNFITTIECFEGGTAFNTGVTGMSFPNGTFLKDVIKTLAGTLPFTKVGAIGNYPGQLSRGNAYSGNTVEILSEITGGGFFIDGGKANALQNSEHIAQAGNVLTINSQSGLLGTPIREVAIVRFDMLFEPALNPGFQVKLDSFTDTNFNGLYNITAVKHRGMISDAVCGSVITTGEFVFKKTSTAVQSSG